MKSFNDVIRSGIETAFKTLLTEKHLYQQVEVAFNEMLEVAVEMARKIPTHSRSNMRQSAPPTLATLLDQGTQLHLKCGQEMVTYSWEPTIDGNSAAEILAFSINPSPRRIQFVLPTVTTFCSGCGGLWPFNPSPAGSNYLVLKEEHARYHLEYRCQQCKGIPMHFVVRREGKRLRLVGRDPIEKVPTPKVLPKGTDKYFSDSQIAHHAGQTLAGIFLLRVFVEQFLHSVPAVKELLLKDARAPGDRIAETYQDTLPDAFKERFPSLRSIYANLSEAMHAANADAELYERNCREIVKHFEARSLFEL